MSFQVGDIIVQRHQRDAPTRIVLEHAIGSVVVVWSEREGVSCVLPWSHVLVSSASRYTVLLARRALAANKDQL